MVEYGGGSGIRWEKASIYDAVRRGDMIRIVGYYRGYFSKEVARADPSVIPDFVRDQFISLVRSRFGQKGFQIQDINRLDVTVESRHYIVEKGYREYVAFGRIDFDIVLKKVSDPVMIYAVAIILASILAYIITQVKEWHIEYYKAYRTYVEAVKEGAKVQPPSGTPTITPTGMPSITPVGIGGLILLVLIIILLMKR